MKMADSYIYLQWIGNDEAEGEMLSQVKDHVERIFSFPARIRRVAARPTGVLDFARGQCSSTKILRWVLEDVPSDARKILSITDCDLFIPVLTFVFGEAQLGGKGALVSIARLRRDLGGLPLPRAVCRERLLKECVHELGHTFGLVHCSSSHCAMVRSNSVLDVDRKSGHLCRGCHSNLRRLQAKE
jgi:archaemetzincin